MVLQCLDKCGRFIDIYLSKRPAVRPLVCQLINLLPLYIVSTGCQLSYFKRAQTFTLILLEVNSNKTHILGIRNMNVDDESESECPVSLCSDFEGDFGQTMELLEMDIEEIQVNVEHLLEEVYVI